MIAAAGKSASFEAASFQSSHRRCSASRAIKKEGIARTKLKDHRHEVFVAGPAIIINEMLGKEKEEDSQNTIG